MKPLYMAWAMPGGVVHLNEVGDIAGGDDDGLDDLRQLRGDFVGLAVRHGLLAPAEDGGGAHGAEGDAMASEWAGTSLREEMVHS